MLRQFVSISIAFVSLLTHEVWALEGQDQILFVSSGLLSSSQQCSVSFVRDPVHDGIDWACTAAHCVESPSSEAKLGLNFVSLSAKAFQAKRSLMRDYACAPIRAGALTSGARRPVSRELLRGETLVVNGFPGRHVVKDIECVYGGYTVVSANEFFKSMRLRPFMICSGKGLANNVHGLSGAGVATKQGEFAGTITTARDLPRGGFELTFAPADQMFDLGALSVVGKKANFTSAAPLLYGGLQLAGEVTLAAGDVVQALDLTDGQTRVEGLLKMGRTGAIRFSSVTEGAEFGRLVVREDGSLRCVESEVSRLKGRPLCHGSRKAGGVEGGPQVIFGDKDLNLTGPMTVGAPFSNETLRKDLYPLGSPNILVRWTSRLLSEAGYWDRKINEIDESEIYKVVLFCQNHAALAKDQLGCVAANIKQGLLTQVRWTREGLDESNPERSYCQSVIESVLSALDLLNIPGLRAQRHYLWTAIDGNELPHVALEILQESSHGQQQTFFFDPSFLPLKLFPMGGN